MARFGTPHEGVDNILVNAYSGLQVILYTNAADSLDRDTVIANLTQPGTLDGAGEANGYGPISLTGVWTGNGSVITYDHGTPDDVEYTNTGTQGSWDTAVGAAVTDGTYILHFADFGTAIPLPLGATLRIDVSSIVSP